MATNERRYYAVPFRLDGNTRAFIWFSNETDGVVLAPSRWVLVLDDVDDAARHCATAGLGLQDERTMLFDFDLLQHWLAQDDDKVDCEFLLNMWNMLGDIAASVEGGTELFDPGDLNGLDLYETLFSGTDAADVVFTTGRCEPEWDKGEIVRLKSFLRAGLSVARSALTGAQSEVPPE